MLIQGNIFIVRMCSKYRLFSNICRLKPYKDTKWLMPDGNPIGVNVFNCVAKQKVPIILPDPHIATWYSCGPTVYDSAHIGHASCYVKLDIIQRILKNYFKINLISAMGVTNIDDKIIKKSNEENIDFEVIAKKYEQEFWRDMTLLGVEKPVVITRVSDYMQTIELFVKRLIEAKQAYIADDNSVYFDVENYKNYGKLQEGQSQMEALTEGKRNEMDFAIWKGAKPGEPSWKTEWGNGRPGWHIECSAMVSRIFGPQLDFHAGGIDLKFPHHENEETQSCAYHNTKQWVNYWIHVGHLHVKNDVKMSKSLKNTISITEVLHKYNPDSFRMLCLLSHYRNKIEYSDEVIKTADKVLEKFKYFLIFCEQHINDSSKESHHSEDLFEKLVRVQEKVDEALRDDFDSPKSINYLLNLMTDVHKVADLNTDKHYPVEVALISGYISKLLSCFGIKLGEKSESNVNYDELLDCIVEFRQNVRLNALKMKDKDLLKACDIVRDRLKVLNVKVNDSNNGKAMWIKSK